MANNEPKPAKKVPGRKGYRYRQQYGNVVICDNEQAQARTYARLQRAGYSVPTAPLPDS